MAKKNWVSFEEVKKNANVEQVLLALGIDNLQISGADFRGKSPFRSESDNKTAFSIDRNTGIWNDFPADGEKKKGNILELVMHYKNIEIREAALWLQELQNGSKSVPGANSKKDDTKPIKDAEEKPAVNPILENLEPKPLKLKRDIPFLVDPVESGGKNFSAATLEEFDVGYFGGNGMMKGRVCYPIHNRDGRIVAYCGRSLKKETPEEGKYKFPPKFRKSLELYNLHRAISDPETREVVLKHGLILVEGFNDVLKLWENGIKNVVALMGRELSQEQEEILLDRGVNPSRKLTLFLDADDPGIKAQRQLAERLCRDFYVRLIHYPADQIGRTEPEHFSATELKKLFK